MILALAACGGARTVTPVHVETGDPLPAHATETDACRGGDRWLDSDPHVPLAIVDNDGLHAADDCCASWAHAGDQWTSVDAWGAPTGTHAVTGGEGYDVTQCYELGFDGAASLMVRGDQPWRAPASAAWVPDAAARDAAFTLADTLDRALARTPVTISPDQVTPESPVEARAVFFEMAAMDNDPEAPTRFVAIGGRSLAIAGLDAGGAWRILYLDASWGFDQAYIGDIYKVIGVFDMDGDGFPEVIVHRNAGDSWDDLVLGCDHDSSARTWREGPESVGGSTA